MVKDTTKRKVGIILIIIGVIFYPFIFISTMTIVLLPISIIFILIGIICLYRGLSLKNRGVMLIIIGGFFIFFTTFIFINAIPHINPVIALSIVNITFWGFCFIIPGIVKILKKTEFDDKTKYWYALAPLTTFWLLVYTIVITAITANTPTTFVTMYTQYFIYALGGGFLISLIVIGLAYLDIYF